VRSFGGPRTKEVSEALWHLRSRHSERKEALDYDVIEQSQDVFQIDVTRCSYAEFYRELGEPELGFLLVCSSDFDMVAGYDPDVKLARTQTIMQGAKHCDFRYKRSR
jgi:hypothetical protein